MGQPLSNNACLIGAAICGAITLWFLAGVWFPRLRFVWEGSTRRVSTIASVAGSLFSAAFTIGLLASGIHYKPVTDHGLWIVGLGFLAVVAVFIYDHFGKPT